MKGVGRSHFSFVEEEHPFTVSGSSLFQIVFLERCSREASIASPSVLVRFREARKVSSFFLCDVC